MACRDCGQQQQVTSQPCRTFSFPLGTGEVDFVFRGEMIEFDLGPLVDYASAVRQLYGRILAQGTLGKGAPRG